MNHWKDCFLRVFSRYSVRSFTPLHPCSFLLSSPVGMAGRGSGPEILAFSVLQFGSIAKCEPAWGGCPTLENVQEKTFFFCQLLPVWAAKRLCMLILLVKDLQSLAGVSSLRHSMWFVGSQ